MIQPNPDLVTSGSDESCRSSERTPSFSRTLRQSSAALPLEEIPVAELVRLAAADDPRAQTELMRRYSRRVAGFVRTLINQPDAIEDVAQMVFIKMFRRLSRLRDPGVFESWLFTLARNASLDFLRRRRCRPSTVGLDDEIDRIPDPSDSQASTEILAALDHALVQLSPIDRTLVTHFVAGDTYGEIAQRTGLSLASVKVRLHRVRPFLRKRVGELTDTRQPGAKGWRRMTGGQARAGSSLLSGAELRVAA